MFGKYDFWWYILFVDIITFKKFVQKSNGLDRFLLSITVFGIVVAFVSLFRGIMIDRKVQVEYLSGSDVAGSSSRYYFVDIEGAVFSPGVYKIAEGSRIKDVLVLAGGLSDEADREFCEKSINFAEEVKDGQKIYIPKMNNTNAGTGYPEANNGVSLVNVNTASLSELDTLWGVGEARAESIVKNRPYQNLEELVSKGSISKSILERNASLMTVY